MNPSTEPPQLEPPQPRRPSTSCDRHPDHHFTSFCPSCLFERLSLLDPSSSSSSSRKPPNSLKSIFSSKTSFLPELRRTKSFSASKNDGLLSSVVFEPQRKSCDVRVRNTLCSLFTQDGVNPIPPSKHPSPEIELAEPRISTSTLFESIDIQPHSEVQDFDNEDFEKVLEEPNFPSRRNSNARPIEDIIIEEEEDDEEEDTKAMNVEDHIDVDSQTKKPSEKDSKEKAGSFWSAAASVLTKKLKLKKRRRNGAATLLPVEEKPIGRQYRDTHSEIADYGFGRRSCDMDPRFSLDDARRVSFDDEPRASWDGNGYLLGRSFPRMPAMVSVVEDAPVNVVVSRSDAHIPVEEPMPMPMSSINENEDVPGGSAQTREYYSDSLSLRRKSVDRSNSIRRNDAEIGELKSVSNAKVSPATGDYFLGPKLVIPDGDFKDSNSNSLRDDCSETFELGSRDNFSVVGNGERKGSKKSRGWKVWNIWGLIHRRNVNKDEDDDRYSRAKGVERSFSESWQGLRGEHNGDVKGGFNPKLMRSNSSVSWRNSQSFNGGELFDTARKSSVETNGHYGRKKDDFVLERSRSARYSPNHFENGGLLRLNLTTPIRSSSKGGWVKSKPNHPHSIAGSARSVLRMF